MTQVIWRRRSIITRVTSSLGSLQVQRGESDRHGVLDPVKFVRATVVSWIKRLNQLLGSSERFFEERSMASAAIDFCEGTKFSSSLP